MDWASLTAFVAVAEHGGFSAAAGQLHLTQPAISKRIALLEASLDARLFDRLGRQILLTEAGRLLLPRAKQMLAEADAGRGVRTSEATRAVLEQLEADCYVAELRD